MKVMVLGVGVDRLTMESAVDRVTQMLDEEGTKVIYTPNSEILMAAKRDPLLKEILNRADMTTADGIGVVKAASMLGDPLPERVAGFDLCASLMPVLTQKKKSLYILGGKPGVAEAAVNNLKEKHPELTIAGCADGYFKDDAEVIKKINEAQPDFLMVCLGAPRQEKWIDAHKNELSARVIIGAGGSVDVFAGTVKRAPKIFIKLNLEWFYRLLCQPSRIGRMMDLPRFMRAVRKEKRG